MRKTINITNYNEVYSVTVEGNVYECTDFITG